MNGIFTYNFDVTLQMGRSNALAVHCRLLYAETAVRFQASNCDFSGGQSSIGTGFSQRTSVFYCQYHSTNTSILIFYMLLLSQGQAGKA
jgi:hypothetical protein